MENLDDSDWGDDIGVALPNLTDLVVAWLKEKIVTHWSVENGRQYNVVVEAFTPYVWDRIRINHTFVGYVNNERCLYNRGFIETDSEPFYAADPNFFLKIEEHIKLFFPEFAK